MFLVKVTVNRRCPTGLPPLFVLLLLCLAAKARSPRNSSAKHQFLPQLPLKSFCLVDSNTLSQRGWWYWGPEAQKRELCFPLASAHIILSLEPVRRDADTRKCCVKKQTMLPSPHKINSIGNLIKLNSSQEASRCKSKCLWRALKVYMLYNSARKYAVMSRITAASPVSIVLLLCSLLFKPSVCVETLLLP